MIMNCHVPKEFLAGKICLVFKSSGLVELWKVSEVDLIIWPAWLLYKVNIINEHLISSTLQENCFGRKACSWVAFDSLFSNAYLPGSAGKSCLLGRLHSICFFGIPRAIQTHLYLDFHHGLFCCKYRVYWHISLSDTPLLTEDVKFPSSIFYNSISQRYKEQ